MKFQLSHFNYEIDFSTRRLHTTLKIPANYFLVRFTEWQHKTATRTTEVPATRLPKAQDQEVLMKKPCSSSHSPVSILFFLGHGHSLVEFS